MSLPCTDAASTSVADATRNSFQTSICSLKTETLGEVTLPYAIW